jgi:hypothetical protein
VGGLRVLGSYGWIPMIVGLEEEGWGRRRTGGGGAVAGGGGEAVLPHRRPAKVGWRSGR